MTYDFGIVGGGIVGLSSAWHILRRYPGASLVLFEKERAFAGHQTGNNSGVIHSGIYYKPGSFKARFAAAGARSMVEFCREHGIAHEVCGKVIVATQPSELPQLERLCQRGLANGIPVRRITPLECRAIEPFVRSVGAVHVASTGITSYRSVCDVLARLASAAGAEIRLGARVVALVEESLTTRVVSDSGEVSVGFLVNCAGLHSDRIARSGGARLAAKIVPFRGEYYELAPGRRHLCRNLIYPVPNPNFPFLGVHYTRMIDGSVHCGPNAVLALKREGYHKTDFDWRDAMETLSFGGFWRLAAKYWREGTQEMVRSLSKVVFLRSLQRLIPEVRMEDLVPSHAGIRAQALMPDGKLVDDFLIIDGPRSCHVCNAPSPAATSSLEIGRYIASRIPEPARQVSARSA